MTTLYRAAVTSISGSELILHFEPRVSECPPMSRGLAFLVLASAALDPMPDALVGSLPRVLAESPDALFGWLEDLVEQDVKEIDRLAARYIDWIRVVGEVVQIEVTDARWLDHVAVGQEWEGLFVCGPLPDAPKPSKPPKPSRPALQVGARVAVKIDTAERGTVTRVIKSAVEVALDHGLRCWVSRAKLVPVVQDTYEELVGNAPALLALAHDPAPFAAGRFAELAFVPGGPGAIFQALFAPLPPIEAMTIALQLVRAASSDPTVRLTPSEQRFDWFRRAPRVQNPIPDPGARLRLAALDALSASVGRAGRVPSELLPSLRALAEALRREQDGHAGFLLRACDGPTTGWPDGVVQILGGERRQDWMLDPSEIPSVT